MATKASLLTALTDTINQSTVPDEGELTQEQLNQLTDEVVATVNTINRDREYANVKG